MWIHAGITIMLLVKEKSSLFKTRLLEAGAKVELLEMFFCFKARQFFRKTTSFLCITFKSHLHTSMWRICIVFSVLRRTRQLRNVTLVLCNIANFGSDPILNKYRTDINVYVGESSVS